MTNRSYHLSHRRRDGVWVTHDYVEILSGNSPRGADGRLRLQANTCDIRKGKVMSHYETGSYAGNKGYSADHVANYQRAELYDAAGQAEAKAYRKLRSLLYDGNASLGVTLASWKQSQEMIVKRAKVVETTAEHLRSLSSRRKIVLPKRVADSYLEVIFGWQPLIADIKAACDTVIQSADRHEFVRTSGRAEYQWEVRKERPGWYKESAYYHGTVRCVAACGVRITNPNLWLAERAGLINPLAVAWDVVPFSFLINMVSNVGALVNSISDFAGLAFDQPSVTFTSTGNRAYSREEYYPLIGSEGQHDQLVWKFRELRPVVLPRTLDFRPPKVDWGTAAMAASLMVQQAVPALRLVGRLTGRL